MSKKCVVRENKFVDACDALNKACEIGNPPKGKSRGIYAWSYTSSVTRKKTRLFFGAKTSDQPNGLAFNFCPWCGENISAPFADTPGDAR